MPHVVNRPLIFNVKKLNFIQNSPFSWWLNDGQTKLPPEVERDNVEYKVFFEFQKPVFFYFLVEIDGNVGGEAGPFSDANEMASRRNGALLVHFGVK